MKRCAGGPYDAFFGFLINWCYGFKNLGELIRRRKARGMMWSNAVEAAVRAPGGWATATSEGLAPRPPEVQPEPPVPDLYRRFGRDRRPFPL